MSTTLIVAGALVTVLTMVGSPLVLRGRHPDVALFMTVGPALVGPIVLGTWRGSQGALAYGIGVFLGLAGSQPILLVLLGSAQILRRRRGKPELTVEPPTRMFGQEIVRLPSGSGFFARPTWTRWKRYSERVTIGDDVIEVPRGQGETIAELLARSETSYARGGVACTKSTSPRMRSGRRSWCTSARSRAGSSPERPRWRWPDALRTSSRRPSTSGVASCRAREHGFASLYERRRYGTPPCPACTSVTARRCDRVVARED